MGIFPPPLFHTHVTTKMPDPTRTRPPAMQLHVFLFFVFVLQCAAKIKDREE